MRKTVLSTLVLLTAVSAHAQQALRLPAPSPKATLMQTVGITDITITYSRPGVKGRQIWGALVPYDKVWRTGANQATIFQFSDDVMINGQKLAKGSYSLHTIPGRDQWTLIFNSFGDPNANYNYDAAKDVLRVMAKPERAEFREWLQFDIPEMTTDTAKIVMRWENVAVPFTVDTQSVQRALTGAEQAITASANARWQTPFRAADFAFQNNRMDEAQKWLDMALQERENTATLWLKARMLQKRGQKADAMRTAEQAIAKAGPNEANFAADIRRQSDAWKN
jgi:tetratricopeptide (TPR) repeat protein